MRYILILTILLFNTILKANELPKILLYGELQNEYSIGRMKMYDNEKLIIETNVKLKIRGGTSKIYEKKNIAFKLIDENEKSIDFSFLGMRNDNKWILDAMAIDKARMRNRVSFDLWNDMSKSSYIKEEYEPDALNGIRGKFVEVYLNDEYCGLYCLNEKLDRKQLKLKKYKDGKIKGLLYKADSWKGTTYFDVSYNYENNNNLWLGWDCQYPDLNDGEKIDWQPLVDNISFVVNSNKKTFIEEVEQRFDLPVIIDYIIFIHVIYAQDNSAKNQFAYFYDINKSKKQGFAPWDLDSTFGRGYDGNKTSYKEIPGMNNLYLRIIKEYPDFDEIFKNRYIELRNTFLNKESLIKRFKYYFDYLNDTNVLNKEKERWNYINDIFLDFEHEEEYIYDWIEKRLAFLDDYFGIEYSSIEKTKNTNVYLNNKTYNINGQQINLNKNNNRGIFIKNGRKFIR